MKLTHEQRHARLAKWKEAVDRTQAEIDSPESDYTAKAAARATLNVVSGPRYFNALLDHLRAEHACEPIDPWPYIHEVEAAHDQCHSLTQVS